MYYYRQFPLELIFLFFFSDLSTPDSDNFLFSAAYARPVKSQSGGGGRKEERRRIGHCQKIERRQGGGGSGGVVVADI